VPLFKAGNLLLVLKADGNIIQPAHQPLLATPVDLKREDDRLLSEEGYGLARQIHGGFQPRGYSDYLEDPRNIRLGQFNGQEAVFYGIVSKDIGKPRQSGALDGFPGCDDDR
jgi:hypothetical protein